MGTHKQIKETQMNTQNTNVGYTQKTHSAQPGCMNWSCMVAVHMENFQCIA